MAEISCEKHLNYVRIVLNGRIDGQSAPEIEKIFLSLTSGGERILVADLTSVSYISSAGLRIFLSVQKTLRQISGEIVLFNMPDIVKEVFRISGFISIFKHAQTPAELASMTGEDCSESRTSELTLNGIHIEIKKYNGKNGKAAVFGNCQKLAASCYDETDVVQLDHASVMFGTGLAALGECYDEYKSLFGETLILKKNFFNYPAIKNSAVDFIYGDLNALSLRYQFLHGFGFSGEYSSVIRIDEDEPVTLAQITELAKSLAETDLTGIVLLMESAGILGMNLKKIPIKENKPSSGEIFDHENFADWINFPLEPAFSNHIIAGAGLVARDKTVINEEYASVFSEGSDYHIHAGIFEKGFVSKKPEDFDSELSRVVRELSVSKIQHLLGKSRFKRGLIAIIDLE
ncbi:MAG: STAS domain-containing protein [Bacteroidota bacterium]